MDRKQFLETGSLAAFMAATSGLMTACASASTAKSELFFDISLAQWSLHRTINSGDIDPLDFPATARKEFGIDAVEYVNQFFKDKARDKSYLDEMNIRCNDLGVDQVLIMIDGEGDMAVTDDKARLKSVENHYKWVEAAEYLGCHAIRVNTFGNGTAKEQQKAAVDSLGRLASFAKDYGINILVENHGGYSSNGQWLSEVMNQVGMDNCGTLPDFGNFCVRREEGSRWEGACVEKYDRYQGVEEMMPYAGGVSAKSYAFNEDGEETTIDFSKMLSIIKKAGFEGYIGIEYEGSKLNEFEGIKATKKLLEQAATKVSKG